MKIAGHEIDISKEKQAELMASWVKGGKKINETKNEFHEINPDVYFELCGKLLNPMQYVTPDNYKMGEMGGFFVSPNHIIRFILKKEAVCH